MRASLRKLRTDYIDLLYIHWWDFTTSIEELMISLNTLLQQGKVLYLGASDLPAYVVARCNQYARDHGLRGFVVYQGRWSAMDRDFERDILHLARDDGMGLAPWGALGAGQFKSEAQIEEMKKNSEVGRTPFLANPLAKTVGKVLDGIAQRKNTQITSVALAYVMHKAPYVFPIVGGRKIDHLKGNIAALELELAAADIEEIEGAAPFDPGFPLNAFGSDPAYNFLLKASGHFDYVQRPLPIRPHKEAQLEGKD